MSDQWPVHYGDHFVSGELADRTTIHGSGTIDIQVSDKTGEVVAVWYRCRTLPFRVSMVTAETRQEQPSIMVTAVEYLDGET
jgi:hypothetical protein